jgi:hypothetical protein
MDRQLPTNWAIICHRAPPQPDPDHQQLQPQEPKNQPPPFPAESAGSTSDKFILGVRFPRDPNFPPYLPCPAGEPSRDRPNVIHTLTRRQRAQGIREPTDLSSTPLAELSHAQLVDRLEAANVRFDLYRLSEKIHRDRAAHTLRHLQTEQADIVAELRTRFP